MIASSAVRVRGASMARAPAVRRALATVCMANAAIGMTALAVPSMGFQPDAAVHAFWVIASLLACAGPIARAQVMRQVAAEPALTMIGAYVVYFVAGAAVPLFAEINPEMQALMTDLGTDWDLVLECDAMNSLGLAVALGACTTLRCRWAGIAACRGTLMLGQPSAGHVAAFFLVLGGAIYLPLLTRLASGHEASDVLGGQIVWRTGGLMDCGILLALATCRRGDVLLPGLAVTLAAVQAALGTMAANKSEALTPLAMVLIAWVARQPSFRRLATSGVAALGAMVIVTGIVGTVRATDDGGTRGLQQRAGLVSAAVTEPGAGQPSPAALNAANRLCYLPAQAGAVALHRSGQGDDYLLSTPWLLVPRSIYPDKPVLSERGLHFAERLSGQWGSSASPTLFIDGYHQFGWGGLLAVSWTAGWVVAAFGSFSTTALQRRAYAFLPLVLYGHFIAFRIDGVLLGDHLFGLLLLGLLVLASWAVFPARRRDRRRSDQAPEGCGRTSSPSMASGQVQ